jgi:ubiquinone/menaquinone biosynthesis C-methylase UbiE
MSFDYRETIDDLQTRIDIHKTYGGRDIDRWMLDLLAPAPGLRLLDVGCGSGKQCFAFDRHLQGDASIVGGDVNAELLAQARTGNAQAGQRIAFIELDFNKPFNVPAAAFDLVTCCFAIYYAKDIPFTLRQMHRALVPGGRLFTTGPLPENKQLFYEVIREATGRPIPPMPGSSRYGSEILGALRNLFTAVEVHRFENPLTFREAEPFLAYIRASLSEDRRLWTGFFQGQGDFARVMKQIEAVIRRRLAAEGVLVMTKVVGGFIART